MYIIISPLLHPSAKIECFIKKKKKVLHPTHLNLEYLTLLLHLKLVVVLKSIIYKEENRIIKRKKLSILVVNYCNVGCCHM